MTALGKTGIKDIAYQNVQKAHYAKTQAEKHGLQAEIEGAHFNEFVLKLNEPVKEANERLLEKGIIGGYDLGRDYPELQQRYARRCDRTKNKRRN